MEQLASCKRSQTNKKFYIDVQIGHSQLANIKKVYGAFFNKLEMGKALNIKCPINTGTLSITDILGSRIFGHLCGCTIEVFLFQR